MHHSLAQQNTSKTWHCHPNSQPFGQSSKVYKTQYGFSFHLFLSVRSAWPDPLSFFQQTTKYVSKQKRCFYSMCDLMWNVIRVLFFNKLSVSLFTKAFSFFPTVDTHISHQKMYAYLWPWNMVNYWAAWCRKFPWHLYLNKTEQIRGWPSDL